MLTTFDESYDNNHNYLILGALFCPSHKILHKEFLRAKKCAGYVDEHGKCKEIKYTTCYNHRQYKIAQVAIDCFIRSQAFFRAIVIDQRPDLSYDINYFGRPSESKAIKEARAYKRFAELLLKSSISDIQPNGLLYLDKLTRCRGDAFCELIKGLFGTYAENYSKDLTKPLFKHIQEVDTGIEDYQLGQIGDLLQGVILNELLPGKNLWKKRIRNYVKRNLEIPSLLPDYWKLLSRDYKDKKHHNYQIWYWTPNKE